MKKRIPTFAAGMLTMALIGSLGVGALAASGAMTITVDPINIQVNGATFQPKDANGADVPVFAYNGTTYAPLRALAEAYGLEVGYDASTNMATVKGDAPAPTTPQTPDNTATTTDYSDWSAEEEAAYQEFKGMWEVEFQKGEINADSIVLNANDNIDSLKEFVSINTIESMRSYCQRFGSDLYQQYGRHTFAYRPRSGEPWLWVDEYKDGEWVLGYNDYYYKKIIQM